MTSKKRRREIAWALEFRRQLTEAKLSRREIVKLGVLGSGTAFLGLNTSWVGASDEDELSPPTTVFRDPIRIPPVLQPVAPFTTNPRAHQYYYRFQPRKYYHTSVRANPNHIFHSELPPNLIWGYGDGQYPGPTLDARYGEPILWRVENSLPTNSNTFGIPQVITHLHNFHSASESDGGPWLFYDPGHHIDHHYTMARAGFTSPYGSPTNPDGWGDPRESLHSLFYHAHRPEFTTQNLYKGQVGFCRIFDELDTGNERDGGRALRLPSGNYDVPLVFADKVFDQNGQLFFDAFNLDGILGDKPTVNGVIQPYMRVACRRYRFRLVNTGPSRTWGHYLYNATTRRWINGAFQQIASDGNLLERPVRRSNIAHGVAERYDVVLDFAAFARPGQEIILYNRFEQDDGRRPTGKILNPGIPVMKFIVEGYPAGGDPSRVPSFLREQPTIDLSEVTRERTFRFERQNGAWAINQKFFEPSRASSQALVPRGSTEIWELQNNSGGWIHPIHIHLEEHRILTRNGFAPPVYERGRKDVTVLGRNERVRVFMRFRDFPDPDFSPPNQAFIAEAGRYPIHCHNTTHEDHAMMARWDVVPA